MPQKPDRKKDYAKERRAKMGGELNQKSADWARLNPEKVKQRAITRRLEKRAMCLVASARVRARKRGIIFDIPDDESRRLQSVIDAGVCEVSGVALTLSGPRSATSPSLDRIIPERGYVSGNLRIVCHAVNAGMGDWGEAELLRIVLHWTMPLSRRKRQSL